MTKNSKSHAITGPVNPKRGKVFKIFFFQNVPKMLCNNFDHDHIFAEWYELSPPTTKNTYQHRGEFVVEGFFSLRLSLFL